ncbi:MAG: isocitrate dehydrogenase [Chlamydiae bacterium CG10_big_fil_rev_8_21_14_0_10_42_34]|nr:MAG: isocitrate dehydrogenase [Chlamydiae bacterium CG10_big_fil_rev_8_21_14_0_10_42_34]
MNKTPIAVAEGDGIGPEIMKATLQIMESAGASIEIHKIDIGEKMYLSGFPTGMDPKMWDIIRGTKAFLKAPITTPQGGGFKSLNVTIRTTLGLYANVRPCVSYFPYVATKHPEMDVVIVRENEEDLYSGIEYRQTPDVCSSIKIISRAGTEKIVRYAFEYARRHGRKKVTLFMKDNIMKFSDGLFHKVFDEIAAEYSDILNEHWIVDIGAAKLADTPEIFDVIVMPNLYGDILSDVAAQIAGSVGLAGSANIGEKGAMFEAIHGSAPRRANQNVANPSGLLLAAIQMLDHIGQSDTATTIHNAWLTTLEQGIHTYDIYKDGTSKTKVGTKEFGDAVVKNLGKKPETLKPVVYGKSGSVLIHKHTPTHPTRHLVGVDVYIFFRGELEEFFAKISHINVGPIRLKMITNRGVRVWPEGQPETFCIEQWRCRFLSDSGRTISQNDVVQILHAFDHVNMDVIRGEFLYTFDGKAGYSSAED